jgi:hypothetical protein
MAFLPFTHVGVCEEEIVEQDSVYIDSRLKISLWNYSLS